MSSGRKPLAWLHGEIKTPPFTSLARIEAGELLARLQLDESLPMPHSRPMPDIGKRCHELRVKDGGVEWRIVCRTDQDAIVVLDVFKKKTRKTPLCVLQNCRRRLHQYDSIAGG